jgi:hypothetical protein
LGAGSRKQRDSTDSDLFDSDQSWVENVQAVCKSRCDWIESTGVDFAHAEMGLGTSLIRYRIQKSPEGLVLEVLKHHSIYDGFSGNCSGTASPTPSHIEPAPPTGPLTGGMLITYFP